MVSERSAAHRCWRITLLVNDHGDDDFWREAEGIEPAARVERYIAGLMGAGESITKYALESIDVEDVS